MSFTQQVRAPDHLVGAYEEYRAKVTWREKDRLLQSGPKKIVFCKVARKTSSFGNRHEKDRFLFFNFIIRGKIMKLGFLGSLITNMTSATVPGAPGARLGMPRVGVIFRSFSINRREIDQNFLLWGFRGC